MYVGLAGMLVANAVRLGSWQAFLPVAAFAVAIDRFQIAAEESALLANFGADYEDYRAAVPRWLGRGSVSLTPVAAELAPDSHREVDSGNQREHSGDEGIGGRRPRDPECDRAAGKDQQPEGGEHDR